MKKITVIIPSRDQPSQKQFLTNAITSIKAQSVIKDYYVEIIICIDKGQEAVDLDGIGEKDNFEVKFIESTKPGQAPALNAGINIADADFVSFLEDDDDWNPNFLKYALNVISSSNAGFVSSTQLEHDENNMTIRINDFPTPSSWFMTNETLSSVGKFNEDYKFHLDNEWLGRLSESRIQRVHLVESTAPVRPGHIKQIRPWLYNVINQSDGLVRIARHTEPYPLVNRLIHSRSGMSNIASDPALKQISQKECENLTNHFKRIPW